MRNIRPAALGVALLALAIALPSAPALADHRDEAAETVLLTPVVIGIEHRPIPVFGSDGRYHEEYELFLTNATPKVATIQKAEVLDGDGSVILALDAAQVASRLAVTGRSSETPVLTALQSGHLYLHVIVDRESDVPRRVSHRLTVALEGVQDPVVETGGETRYAPPTDLVLDPPLKGDRYIAADGCCDSIRHVRALLSLNAKFRLSQRFAIDFERLDAQNHIVTGDVSNPANYKIYGEPIYAPANARVSFALDGLPDSPPGQLPPGLSIQEADGNHVILDLGDGRYALLAHMKPGSVKVRTGQRVRRGQQLGNVGTSGNSSEPHLHFHVMDGPSGLLANGVPYTFRSFRATQKGASTHDFDVAAATGAPLPLVPVDGNAQRRWALPLDLWIVDFPQ
jgi:hypothetical protein